jgi:predicted aspartyl protease
LVTEGLIPRITDFYIIGKDGNISIEPILDTGFNGEFSLPKEYRDRCELHFLGEEDFKIANGSIVSEEVYIEQVIMDNKPYLVEVSLTDDEDALLGMGIIKNKIAVFDLKEMKVTVKD